MKYYCGHIEAFSFAYRLGREAYDATRIVSVTSLADCVSRERDIQSIDLAAVGVIPPIPRTPGCVCNTRSDVGKHHVLVGGEVNRKTSSIVVRRRWNGPIPYGAFHLIGPGIYMSSPEFIYVQLASCMTETQLAIIGCSLCSSYRIREDGKLESVQPLTSPKKLNEFIAEAKGAYGIRKAQQALEFVAAGAESPPEVGMYAMTCFPRSMGGLGLPKATLNHVIEVEEEDATTLDRPNRTSWRIDLCWPELRAGVEYLGKWHDENPAIDRERLNSLLVKGYRVLQYDYRHLVDGGGQARCMAQIERLLGVEHIEPSRQELSAREALEDQLYGPNRFRL